MLRLHIVVDGERFRDVWQARFDELFALEDRQHDGHVTVEAARSIARDMNGSLRGGEALDPKSLADGEGRIERSSLLAAIERTLPSFTIRRRSSIARDSALALFPLLDTNHDNRLSADELAATEEQLRQRDFNDDGVVTAGELILDPKAIVAAADPDEADRELATDDSPVVALDALGGQQIAEKLLKHYDRNHDGRLTLAAPEIEIMLPVPLVGRLDANGDGALAADELASFAARAPDLELSFAFGRESVADRRRRRQRLPGEGEFHVRSTLQGGYKVELGDSIVDFKRENRDPRQTDLVEMRTYDRDNNKYIDSNEATANNISKTVFAAMDTDGDGKIFKGELTSFMTTQNAAAAARLQLEVTDQGQNLLEVLDTDGDGVLSPREQRDAKNILASADANGDGSLAGDELPQRFVFELVRGADDAREETVVRGRGPLDRPGQHERSALVSQDGPQQRRRPERAGIRRPARGLPQAGRQRRRLHRPRRGRIGRQVAARRGSCRARAVPTILAACR